MFHLTSGSRVWEIVVLAMVLVAGSAFGSTVSFTPDHSTFVGEDLQTIQVFVEDVTDLLGASMVIGFDPAVVTPVGVTLGEFMDDGPCGAFFQWVNWNDFTNTIEVDAAMLGCSVEGSGFLFDITFAGVGDGISALTVVSGDLRDSINYPIEFTSSDGAVTYFSEVNSDIRFQPESVLFEEDNTTEICLSLENVSDFMGLSVEFHFDPEVIWPLAVYGGPALAETGCSHFLEWINEANIVDTVAIDLALLGCSADVNGSMICLTFQGVQYGESPLTWLDVDVRDSENSDIPVNWHDGMVLYNSAVDVETVNLDELKSIYR